MLDGIRTHTEQILSLLPLPLGYKHTYCIVSAAANCVIYNASVREVLGRVSHGSSNHNRNSFIAGFSLACINSTFVLLVTGSLGLREFASAQ